MINAKIDKTLIVVQIMWLSLLLRITGVNQNVWILVELVGVILCLVFIFTNIKHLNKNALLLVILFAITYLVSSLLNSSYNGNLITYTGIIFSCKVFIFFTVPWIAIRKKGSKKFVQASWNCLILYWIPSVITVLVHGQDAIDNANNIYFIGNKFNIAYLNVVMLCLLLFLNDDKSENGSRGLHLRINKKKICVFLFYIMIIFLDYYMKAYTGLFMIFMILIFKYLSFRIDREWSRLINFIGKPVVMIVSVVFSGVVAIILKTIMNIPIIESYLTSIGKTGNMLSRTLIYKNLAEIITKKPLIGYGYGTSIVSRYFGPNAQNGLAQVIIYIGILGALFMLLVILYCCKVGDEQSKNSSMAVVLYTIYAFILAATVEITYGGTFFILLAFYCACGWEKKLS